MPPETDLTWTVESETNSKPPWSTMKLSRISNGEAEPAFCSARIFQADKVRLLTVKVLAGVAASIIATFAANSVKNTESEGNGGVPSRSEERRVGKECR